MKSVGNLFFTDIDFSKPTVMQGLELNFNFCLSILLGDANNRYLTTY